MIPVNKIHKFTCINTIEGIFNIFNTWWKQVNTNTNSTKGNLFCIGSRGGGYTGCNCSLNFKEMGGKTAMKQTNEKRQTEIQLCNIYLFISQFMHVCNVNKLVIQIHPPGPFEKNSGSATDIFFGKNYFIW